MSEILFEAVAEKAAPKQLLDALTPLVNECKMHFNDGGVTVRAVDAANVAMVDAHLSAAAFESYESPGAVTQGVNLDAMSDRISVGGGSDLVNLSLDMESRKLNIDVDNIQQAMALIDPDAIRQEPDLPDLDLPNDAVLEGAQLDAAVSAVDMVSDHVDVVGDVAGGTVEFVGRGDTDETVVTYGPEDAIDVSGVVEDTKSIYSLEFIEAFVDPIPSDADVTLSFGDEFPLWLEWSALEGEFTVTQMVAPRIQSK
jgi:proliferating cell nuclear antigen